MKQSQTNLKVLFRLILVDSDNGDHIDVQDHIQIDIVLMEVVKLRAILRHRIQKSETPVWPIYFMMVKLMPKLIVFQTEANLSCYSYLEKLLSKNFILRSSKKYFTITLICHSWWGLWKIPFC